MADSLALTLAKRKVVQALQRLESIFAPEAKLSFIMRIPNNPNATLIVSADDPDALIAAITAEIDRHRRKCEGCGAPAVQTDEMDIPLCAECFDALPLAPTQPPEDSNG